MENHRILTKEKLWKFKEINGKDKDIINNTIQITEERENIIDNCFRMIMNY